MNVNDACALFLEDFRDITVAPSALVDEEWKCHATTLFGMTVTDCWKAYAYALPDRRVTLREFADRMAYDLVHNRHSSDLKEDRSLVPLVVEVDTGADV